MKRSLRLRRALDADHGAAGAGELVLLLQRVDVVAQRIAAILRAEHHLDAVGRERRLDAVHAEVAVDHAVVDLLADAADLQAVRLEVVELGLGHAARLERIPGDAQRIRAVDHRAAGRHAADVDDVDRADQPALDEVVLRPRVDGDARVLRRDVVAPGLVDGAAHARDRAERGVREGLQAAAAFDVAPPDVQRHRVAVRDFGRAAADVGEAVDRQERVVAVDRPVLKKLPPGAIWAIDS